MELYLHDYSFETVLNSIKGKELEHEPGGSGDFSSSGGFDMWREGVFCR